MNPLTRFGPTCHTPTAFVTLPRFHLCQTPFFSSAILPCFPICHTPSVFPICHTAQCFSPFVILPLFSQVSYSHYPPITPVDQVYFFFLFANLVHFLVFFAYQASSATGWLSSLDGRASIRSGSRRSRRRWSATGSPCDAGRHGALNIRVTRRAGRRAPMSD